VRPASASWRVTASELGPYVDRDITGPASCARFRSARATSSASRSTTDRCARCSTSSSMTPSRLRRHACSGATNRVVDLAGGMLQRSRWPGARGTAHNACDAIGGVREGHVWWRGWRALQHPQRLRRMRRSLCGCCGLDRRAEYDPALAGREINHGANSCRSMRLKWRVRTRRIRRRGADYVSVDEG
jgi:hypothetical protein